jgi:SPP1 family predicted phage head-tail adaptor
MRPGTLSKRVMIQRRVETQNEVNEVVISFIDWYEVWASIEPLSGREYFAAQQVSSDVSTRIRIRSLSGVTQKMRVLYKKAPDDTQVYEIDSVIPVREGNREIDLMCRKVFAEGFRADGSRD